MRHFVLITGTREKAVRTAAESYLGALRHAGISANTPILRTNEYYANLFPGNVSFATHGHKFEAHLLPRLLRRLHS